jgi:small subunit ribosomal protein S4
MLEMRLDNVAYRLGFAPSRRASRQFVRHGHIEVNGRRLTIPSAMLRAGDVVTVVNNKESRAVVAPFMEAAQSRGISPWLVLSPNEFRGEVKHVPSREEIAPIVNEQLIVELYSK